MKQLKVGHCYEVKSNTNIGVHCIIRVNEEKINRFKKLHYKIKVIKDLSGNTNMDWSILDGFNRITISYSRAWTILYGSKKE